MLSFWCYILSNALNSPSREADGEYVLRALLLQCAFTAYLIDEFLIFSADSVSQGQLLLRDLKIAQYTKLPPRAAFVAQTAGTLLGSILNYILMNSIIDNQREILLSVEGTNIWSGQQPQQYNSQVCPSLPYPNLTDQSY